MKFKNLPFELNENEKISLQIWLDELPKRYLKKDVLFKFDCMNGIGKGVTVICGNKKCNITDYICW